VILCIRKRSLKFFGLFICVSLLFSVFFYQKNAVISTFLHTAADPAILVIDPGHGGEDGGAIALDGSVSESSLNLEIALRLNDLMHFLGHPTVMTRTADVSIHSPSAQNIREKKVSDLHNRVALVNKTENARLLSIHQNSLPSSTVTHGAQVFWNSREGADTWAQSVQDALNTSINIGNDKMTKPIPNTIYLMKNITVPGILVECGFLSNPDETHRLQQENYQLRLAAAIAAGCRNV